MSRRVLVAHRRSTARYHARKRVTALTAAVWKDWSEVKPGDIVSAYMEAENWFRVTSIGPKGGFGILVEANSVNKSRLGRELSFAGFDGRYAVREEQS